METRNFSWHNREAVNELYIHDSEFTGYTYTYDIRRDAHEILLSCKNYFLQKVFFFTFHRVVYHEMQGVLILVQGRQHPARIPGEQKTARDPTSKRQQFPRRPEPVLGL